MFERSLELTPVRAQYAGHRRLLIPVCFVNHFRFDIILCVEQSTGRETQRRSLGEL